MAKPKADAAPELDLLGQLTVTLEGVDYTLRPSRQAISNIERALGKSLAQMMARCATFEASLEELGLCVAELMKAHGVFNPNAGLTYQAPNPERLADQIIESWPVEVSRRLGLIFSGALTGGYTAAGERKAAGTKTEATLTAD